MPRRRTTAEFTRNRQRLIFDEAKPCVECGFSDTDKLECDHIVPVDEGGSDAYENLQVLCEKCHIKKTAKQVNAAATPGTEKARRIRAIKSRSGMAWWKYQRRAKDAE